MRRGFKSRAYVKALFSANEQKSLENMLKRELIYNFGYDNKLAIADVLVKNFLSIIEKFAPDRDKVSTGQIVWLAISKKDYPGYGKKVSNTLLEPVILTLWTKDEIEKIANGIRPNKLLPDRIARACQEAYSQGGLLSLADLMLIFNISLTTASEKRVLWERQNNKTLPTRGSIHDLGLTFSHKVETINLHLKGYFTSEIARKLNHDPNCIDQYIKDFQRVKPFVKEQAPVYKISFFTGISEKLVKEYIKIIKKYIENKDNSN